MNAQFISLVALTCVLSEAAARACPSCLGREATLSSWQWVVGALVLCPLVCALVVTRAIVGRIKSERALADVGLSDSRVRRTAARAPSARKVSSESIG
jgi:hypothetical protein